MLIPPPHGVQMETGHCVDPMVGLKSTECGAVIFCAGAWRLWTLVECEPVMISIMRSDSHGLPGERVVLHFNAKVAQLVRVDEGVLQVVPHP